MSIEDPKTLSPGKEEQLNSSGKDEHHQSPGKLDEQQHHDALHPEPAPIDFTSDPTHPLNWPLRRKLYITALTSLTTLTVTFTSSIFSATIDVTAAEFGVSDVVMLLGVSLFVLGFALGPLVWAPISEIYGRKMVSELDRYWGGGVLLWRE